MLIKIDFSIAITPASTLRECLAIISLGSETSLFPSKINLLGNTLIISVPGTSFLSRIPSKTLSMCVPLISVSS